MAEINRNIELSDDDVEALLNSYDEGITSKAPVLPEGYYKGRISSLRLQSGIIGKGDRIGEVWTIPGAVVALNSTTATALLGRDEPAVYVDSSTRGWGNATLNAIGLDSHANTSLFNQLLPFAAEGGFAELSEGTGDGAEDWKPSPEITAVLKKGVLETYKELKAAAKTEEETKLVPAKVANLQMKHLGEFLAAKPATSECVLWISREKAYNNPEQQVNVVKQVFTLTAWNKMDDSTKSSLLD